MLKTVSFSTEDSFRPECRSFNVAGVDASVEWYGEGSKFLVGLYTENNVLVGTAPRLLAQEQTCGQA